MLSLEVSPRLTQTFSFIPSLTKQTLKGIEFIVHRKIEWQKLDVELEHLRNRLKEALKG